jgi:predicted nucleic acid-binding protein
MTRVVLDTNVLIGAAIRPGGKPDQILRQLPERFELITSKYILAEVDTVVTRRHIQVKYRDQVTPQ